MSGDRNTLNYGSQNMGQFEVLRRPGGGVRKAASPRVLPATRGVQGMERLGL